MSIRLVCVVDFKGVESPQLDRPKRIADNLYKKYFKNKKKCIHYAIGVKTKMFNV